MSYRIFFWLTLAVLDSFDIFSDLHIFNSLISPTFCEQYINDLPDVVGVLR